jgi:glycosyltransferase involved in cell wall biosynthesis
MNKEFSNKPIRILHLISTLDVGGSEENLKRLVTSMNNSLFSNTVVSMTTIGYTGELLLGEGIGVHALNMVKGFPDLRRIGSLRSIINTVRPDIIQGWMYHGNLLSMFFRKRRHLLWNIRCSDMDLGRYGMVYRLTVRSGALCSGLPDRIIVNSLAGKKYHEDMGYKPGKWEVIFNGFDTDLFMPDKNAGDKIRTELGIHFDVPVIGLIARFDPMKDHGTFFNAARLLLDTHPSVHFILAGKGITPNNHELHRLINNQPNSGQFHLLGQRHDIPQLMNALNIASSSSMSEGFPNTIGEAMATGLPCVVTDAGDSRVLVGDTGHVVPRNNPQALSTAWTQLLDAGPGNLRVMGEKARKRIQQHYNLNSTINKYEALYSGLIEKSVT